jgi:hypothetical protein
MGKITFRHGPDDLQILVIFLIAFIVITIIRVKISSDTYALNIPLMILIGLSVFFFSLKAYFIQGLEYPWNGASDSLLG